MPEPVPHPTEQERRVLRAVAQHGTLAAAAEALSLSRHTVDHHIDDIREKAGLRYLPQLIAWAARCGLLDEEEQPCRRKMARSGHRGFLTGAVTYRQPPDRATADRADARAAYSLSVWSLIQLEDVPVAKSTLERLRAAIALLATALLLLTVQVGAAAGYACHSSYLFECDTSGGTFVCVDFAPAGHRYCFDEAFLKDGVFCDYYITYGMNCSAAISGLMGQGYWCEGTIAACQANCSGGCTGW
jgi:DNA-binding CsgD family transcriptional regulator